MASFSERNGYGAVDPVITYREDASANLRHMVVELAKKHGFKPTALRTLLCGVLMVAPDRSNWTDYPNVDDECRDLLAGCAWHDVYDVVEAIAHALSIDGIREEEADAYQDDLNRLFVRDGAGWLMEGYRVVARGSEPFNKVTAEVETLLKQRGQSTAASEIHEAIRDISRRPNPDRTGAVQHAIAAVECVGRTVTGDAQATLGQLVGKRGKELGIPAPLDEAVAKLWGYASQRGRHLREEREPTFDEAELVVTVSAALCTYLSRKAA